VELLLGKSLADELFIDFLEEVATRLFYPRSHQRLNVCKLGTLASLENIYCHNNQQTYLNRDAEPDIFLHLVS
jgi:hypothetical protein